MGTFLLSLPQSSFLLASLSAGKRETLFSGEKYSSDYPKGFIHSASSGDYFYLFIYFLRVTF